MTTTTKDWLTPITYHHWLKHLILPSVLIVGFLLLPNPWLTYAKVFYAEVITIELVNKPRFKAINKPKVELTPKTAEQAPAPVKRPVKPSKTITKPQATTNAEITKPIDTVKPEQQPSGKVSTGQILLSANNRTSIDIPAEFQARTEPRKDFYIPEQEITEWFADIPYLDESVDRPTIQMQFYSEGFQGGIEKFFDKITISKTFTTKYGTKIHCALVGVLAMCGWK